MENYFRFFGLPLKFNVDKGLLRKKYLQNSRAFHPDLAGDDTGEVSAEEKSSHNNEGYVILKDFYENVRYILRLKGKLKEGEKETLDPGFLGEMMDINEGLMELEMDFDRATFDSVRQDANKRLKAIEKALHEKAEQFDEGGDIKLLDDIKTDYLKRKYLLRIRDSIDKFASSSEEA